MNSGAFGCDAGLMPTSKAGGQTVFTGRERLLPNQRQAVCRFNSPTRKRGTGVIHSLTRRVVISALISRTTTLNQQNACTNGIST